MGQWGGGEKNTGFSNVSVQNMLLKKSAVCSFKVTKSAVSRHGLSEAQIICIFCHSARQETHLGLVCQTCLTQLLGSNCFASTISCEGQRSHI